MFWVLQNNLFSEAGYESLLQAVERRGLPHIVTRCIPFAGTLEPDPGDPPGAVIVMGSHTLVREAQRRGWQPGGFLNENFNYRTQWRHWDRRRMLNGDGTVYHFGRVPEQQHPFFIRPVDDGKSFAGKVMDWPTFSEWRDRVLALTPDDHPTIDADTEVVVAEPKRIYREYRTWIVGGRVVTASMYKLGERVLYSANVDPGVIEYAESCADIWTPADAFVLDVAIVGDGRMKIVEVNCLNSAGFYAADVGKLVEALERLGER